MEYFPGDDLFAAIRPRGLPMGNLTSQFWANCYLNGFDHFVTRHLGCKSYLRYVDDMLFFSNDKSILRKWRGHVIDYLAGLRMTIHEKSAQARPVSEGVRFLGFVIYPDHRRLLRRKGIHYRRKLKGLVSEFHRGDIGFEALASSVRGWANHVRFADTEGLRWAIMKEVIL